MKPGEAHDATIAVDALLELMERVPSLRAGLRGLVYDMALSDADYDRLMDAGLIPVEKVRRRNDGSRAAEALGPHDFKTRQGHKDARPAVLILGSPYGSRQASGLSATHEEYHEARETSRPVLVFIEEGAQPSETAPASSSTTSTRSSAPRVLRFSRLRFMPR